MLAINVLLAASVLQCSRSSYATVLPKHHKGTCPLTGIEPALVTVDVDCILYTSPTLLTASTPLLDIGENTISIYLQPLTV